MENFLIYLVKLVGFLPLRLSENFGKFIGFCAYKINNYTAQIALINIKTCFPDLSNEQQQALLKASVINLGKVIGQTLFIWHHNKGASSLVDQIINEELLTNLLNDQKPLVIITNHFGNWEVGGAILAKYTEIHCLYRPIKRLHKFDEYICKCRESTGIKLIPSTQNGQKAILKLLSENKVIGIPADNEPKKNGGVFLPFFGSHAFTSTFVAKIFKKYNANVLLMHAFKGEHGFRVEFDKPNIDVLESDQIILDKINDVLVSKITANPEQYLWTMKKFKIRQDHKDIYPKK